MNCLHCDHDESEHMPRISYSCLHAGCPCRGFTPPAEVLALLDEQRRDADARGEYSPPEAGRP